MKVEIVRGDPEGRGESVLFRMNANDQPEIVAAQYHPTKLLAFLYGADWKSVDVEAKRDDGSTAHMSIPASFILKVAKAIRQQRLRAYRDVQGARTGIDLDKTHGDEDEQTFQGLDALFG